MKINHELINKNKLAAKIGMKPGTISSKLQNANGTNFTEKQLEDMHNEFIDLFCYVFEVDEIIFEVDKIKSIKL